MFAVLPCVNDVFGTSATTDALYEKLAEPIIEGVTEGTNGESCRALGSIGLYDTRCLQKQPKQYLS